MRLVDETTVANWQMGRLEVFFEGSWSQVCAREFDGPDADVACRQLGFGAGTVGPNRVNGAQLAPETTLVFPEVAVTAPGCNGTEANLLECGPAPGRLSTFDSRDCFDTANPGLFIACVADPLDGAPPCWRAAGLRCAESRLMIPQRFVIPVLALLASLPSRRSSRFWTLFQWPDSRLNTRPVPSLLLWHRRCRLALVFSAIIRWARLYIVV